MSEHCRRTTPAEQWQARAVMAEAEAERSREHLEKLVSWGPGVAAPDDCVRDWHEAAAFLDAPSLSSECSGGQS